MKRYYTDEELIEGLRQRKTRSIDYLYDEFFPVVRHFLIHNSGNHQDGEDLFQDALIVLYQQSRNKPFILECSLKTYFMAICKNLWLQRLERKCRLLYQPDCTVHERDPIYHPEDQGTNEELLELQRLLYKNLMLLPKECRNLMQLYCLKIPFKEIARMLHYKDEVYVRTRKYFCKNLLRKRIMNDPECHQFLNYE